MDNNHKLIVRICKSGHWYPSKPPFCHNISNSTCAKNLQSIEDFCAEVTEVKNSDNLFWLPIQRKVKYGPFEITEANDNYGQPINLNISNLELYSGDCVMFDPKKRFLTVDNCTNLHKRVKFFQKNEPKYNCPKNCLSINFQYKCYCKRTTCQNLAKIRNLYEKKIVEKLVGQNLCQLDKIYPNQPSYLNRTVWQTGLVETDCKICEERAINASRTKLDLVFVEEKKSLYLLVYAPEGIKMPEKEKYSIYCFTNSAKKQLKEKLKIEQVFANFDNFISSSSSFLVYKIEVKKYLGEYWCEAFSSENSIVSSNKVLAYTKKKGNEYALRFVIKDICKFYSCDLFKIINGLLDKKLKDIFESLDSEIRIMEIFNFDIYRDFLDVLVHVSTGKNANVETEYKRCHSFLRASQTIELKFFKNSEYCLPEETWLNNSKLTWPLTKHNEVAVSDQFCLLEDGTPITRQCQGNFLYGADWENVSNSCVKTEPTSDVTMKLREMAKRVSKIPIQDLLNVINNVNLDVLDIYYLDVILDKIRQNSSLALSVVDKLITTDRATLEKSQKMLNLTDTTLELTEEILSNSTFDPESVYCLQKNNLVVHVANPFLTNISGFLLYTQNSSKFQVVDIKRGETINKNRNVDLQLALQVPEKLLDQILNETEGNISSVFIISVVFYNDSLFVNDDNFHSDSFVISVTIPGHGAYLQTPISIAFKSNSASESNSCGFWDHGKKTNLKKGQWSDVGSRFVGRLNGSDLMLCSYMHLTHFALLLMSDKKNFIDEVDIVTSGSEDNNEYILNVLTIIGCSFSIFGIIGVFLTALFYREWRRKTGTKILINLCIAILLEIICIQLSEIEYFNKSEHLCKIIGMVLHYVVLSKFCWMLIYAFLQYYRFVKVIGAIPTNLILKSVIFGWGVPLAFVFVIGLSTTQSYVSKTYELCYPRGLLFYLTVVMPICLIIFANITIFVIIMDNITHTVSTNTENKKMFKPRLYLALLLFSTLGMPWIFGLVAELLNDSFLKMTLYYIFCITATLQGFILSLFYVVLNKETRNFWMRYILRKKS